MRFFRAIWGYISGWFGSKGEKLYENKYVMAATYDKAISNQEERFKTVTAAVAELLTIEETRVKEIKELGKRLEHLTNVKAGAQTAMQKRINECKGSMSKEQILADIEFIKHQSAFNDVSSTLEEVKKQYDSKEADLNERKAQSAKFKAELQSMQRSKNTLKDEKNEALADVAIAQQQEAINSVLAGITSDTSDKDLEQARAARDRTKSRAKVISELAGNDASVAENQYLQYAQTAASTSELDQMLDWGNEKSDADLTPAKLAE